MINLMLVAGEQSKKLAHHLTNNGAFKAEYILQTLEDNQEQLKNSIIKVDKLLFIYRPEQMNIRNEMSILKDLFLSESYFEARSVIFIQTESSESKIASDYFNTTMQECNAKAKYGNVIDYELYTVKGDLTFNLIKDTVLSITKINNKKNTVSNFVRYEKNNKASKAYDSADTHNHKIEPYDYSSIIKYEREQENTLALETGVIRHTNGDDIYDTLDNPTLGTISLLSKDKAKSFILTGSGKSGKSTLAIAFAVSTIASGESILVLDLTNSCCIQTKLEKENILHRAYTPAQLITYQFDSFNGITICAIPNKELIQDFISVFYTNIVDRIAVDNILIVVNNTHFTEVVSSVNINLTNSFICIHPLISDVLLAGGINDNELFRETGKFPTIILNKNLKLNSNETWIEPREVKKYFPDNRIISHLQISSFRLDETLHHKVLNRE